ncbi:MAG: hypothetical protein WKF35_12265 [Ferruginibacter sp.]
MFTKLLYFSLFSLTFLFQTCNHSQQVQPEIVFNKLLQKFNSPDTSLIFRLDTFIDFKWDRLIILKPYFSKKNLQHCGIIGDIPSSKLNFNEGSVEYLFIKDSKVIKHLVSNDHRSHIALIFEDNDDCGFRNTPNTYIKLSKYYEKEKFKIFKIFNK